VKLNTKLEESFIYNFFVYLIYIMLYLIGVAPMVQDAKLVAMNIHDNTAISRWRENNRAVCISYLAYSIKIQYVYLTQYVHYIYIKQIFNICL